MFGQEITKKMIAAEDGYDTSASSRNEREQLKMAIWMEGVE